MKTAISLLVLLTSIHLIGQTNENLAVSSYTLDNGFTVFLNSDSTASRVYGAVMVKAGAKQEDPTATGMAHYLEHLLFKGTDELGTWDYEAEKPHLEAITSLYEQLAEATSPEQKAVIQRQINEEAVAASKYALPNEFDRLLRSIGGTGINAFTSYEMTFYHNSFPSNELEKWMELYSERFENPVFRTFQSELEVVYEEKNRAMDSFERRIFEQMSKLTFPNLPYGQWSVLGSIEHLKTPSLTKMYTFFDKHYVPGNMSLILTGNFDEQVAKTIIEEKFGSWEARPVPNDTFPELEKIEGEKVEKVRMTPVKAGFLAFQTVGHLHPDRRALEIAENLLYNEAETGFINQIQLNNEMIYAGSFASVYADAGDFVVFYVPKILVQSMGNAQKRITSAFDNLKSGAFTDEMFLAAKSDLSRTFQKQIEDLESRGVMIGEAFNLGISWDQMLSYPDRIDAVSKEDVIRVANQYFGENRVRMISRTGFPKKEKLDKPPYKPVVTEQTKSSDYAASFEAINSLPFKPKFLDFDNDINRLITENGHELLTVFNPINDLFTLQIRFKKGVIEDPKLDIVAQMANYSGAGDYKLEALKQAFASIGCSYEMAVDLNYLTISLNGNEKELKKALILTDLLLTSLAPTEKAKAAMEGIIKTDRKVEKKSPSEIATAMLNYACYKEKSYYLNRLTEKEIAKLDIQDLKITFEEVVKNYQAEIIFSGKTSADELNELLTENLTLSENPISTPFQYRGYLEVQEPTVLFIDDKKAVQSQVYFYTDSSPLEEAEYVAKEAFNQYFGGGFSGIVLQEIREYRSLAYATAAVFQVPPLKGEKTRMITFVGCQADKTMEVVTLMNQLLTDLPIKEERIADLKKNLQMSINTNYPDFRALPDEILDLERLGYDTDPNRMAFTRYQSLEMKDIEAFFNKRIGGKPFIITIYGDKRKIDMDELRKMGKVEMLKVADVMKL